MENDKMEILNQSCVERAKRLSSSIHIQYVERTAEPTASSETQKDFETAGQSREFARKTSMVVIRRPYSYLESAVREMFEGTEDVAVILDRRQHERRQAVISWIADRRNASNDRRRPAPMLDIVLGVGT